LHASNDNKKDIIVLKKIKINFMKLKNLFYKSNCLFQK